MAIDIEEEKHIKKENFKNGLVGFLEEYQFAIDNPSRFRRHSDNCGNQARKVAEAFCRWVILNSDKPDGQKENEIQGTLGTLLDKVTRSSNVYIVNEREREKIKERLSSVKNIGNDASHDNSVITTQRDLDEIKNSLLYCSDYIFGENITQNLIKNIKHDSFQEKKEIIENYIVLDDLTKATAMLVDFITETLNNKNLKREALLHQSNVRSLKDDIRKFGKDSDTERKSRQIKSSLLEFLDVIEESN